MHKKIYCSLLLCFVLFFTACVPQNIGYEHPIEEPEYTMSKSRQFVHQNVFYYCNNTAFLYYCPLEKLSEAKTYARCLCFDPLCEHGGYDTATCMGHIPVERMCLRTTGDTTFLYAVYETLTNSQFTYEIARYDISNAKKTVLLKGIEKAINRFFVTDDLIVFEENHGPYTIIKAYSITNDKCYELPNENQTFYNLIGYDNGLIYYNDISNNVYSNSPTLDQEEKIFTGVLPYGYDVYNGNLYFPYNVKTEKVPEVDWVSFNSIDVYKTPLSSPSNANSTMVAKDVCSYGKPAHFIFDDTFYYLPCEPSYIGQFTESYGGMPDMIHTVVDEHGGALYSVDLQRLRKTDLVEGLEYNIYELVYASPEYVIFFTNASGNRTDIPFSSYAAVVAYEVKTKECYMIVD